MRAITRRPDERWTNEAAPLQCCHGGKGAKRGQSALMSAEQPAQISDNGAVIGDWVACFKPGPCPCPSPCKWAEPLILGGGAAIQRPPIWKLKSKEGA